MIAHVVRFEVSAEQLEDARELLETEVSPRLAKMDGLVESLFLQGRKTGEALLITLWESEGHIAAAEDRWCELGASRGALESTGGRRIALGHIDVAVRTTPVPR